MRAPYHSPCAHVSYLNSGLRYVNTKPFGFFMCEYKIKIYFCFCIQNLYIVIFTIITLPSLLKTHISTNTCGVSISSTYWYLVPQSSCVTQVQARSQFEHLAGIRLVWGTLVVTPSTLKEKTFQSVYHRQPQTTIS